MELGSRNDCDAVQNDEAHELEPCSPMRLWDGEHEIQFDALVVLLSDSPLRLEMEETLEQHELGRWEEGNEVEREWEDDPCAVGNILAQRVVFLQLPVLLGSHLSKCERQQRM